MSTDQATALLPEAAALSILCYVAYTDWRKRRIPNTAILLLIALFPVYCLTQGYNLRQASIIVAIAGAVAALFLVFYLRRGMAAGDVKLAFAAFLWVQPTNLILPLVVLASLSLLLALLYSAPSRTHATASLPYGVALALTGASAIVFT